jgi:SAM-dependent methyltransferase
MIREAVKWVLFPGFNLHARERYLRLPELFGSAVPGQDRRVLDAGCGNGMLAYKSYLNGNRVLGISIKDGEVARCKKLFQEHLRIAEERLSFRVHNLYRLDELGERFDEIICSEVLEHIRDDHSVCAAFWRVLKPGGVLHLCCPNADHPYHRDGEPDLHEAGGHVRAGYTAASYRELLVPIGFEIERVVGLGGRARQTLNRAITFAGRVGGIVPTALAFAVSAPFLVLDGGTPKVPFSLLVEARKPPGH